MKIQENVDIEKPRVLVDNYFADPQYLDEKKEA